MSSYHITTREEYDYARSRGYEPLIDTKHFSLDIKLRIELQKEIFGQCVFGRGNIPVANQRFYKWVWEHSRHYCEETLRPLPNYSASYISHILSRGAHPAMAHDPRNVNILCYEMHSKWENGNRKEMRIFERNQKIIETLMREYYGSKQSDSVG